MTQKEFETRYGKKVEREYYERVIEPAYMATSYADKDAFVNAWTTPDHEDIIRNLTKVAECNREALSNALKLQDELAYLIADEAEASSNSRLREKAIEILGKKEYLIYKLEKGYNLWEADINLILSIIR